MKQEIVHDPVFLAQPSLPATREDLQTALDLMDTLVANRDRCVGMAANMIGVLRRIIVFVDQGSLTVMFNPEIVKKKDRYEAEEGCLSLSGTRKTQRWRTIKVKYQTEEQQTRFKTYSGWTAQIIQHEIDHCNGVLI
jgi:peptide deformylase